MNKNLERNIEALERSRDRAEETIAQTRRYLETVKQTAKEWLNVHPQGTTERVVAQANLATATDVLRVLNGEWTRP